MAQPMMHLLVADKVYTKKSSYFNSYGDFLLGSIAPDAVHKNKNYTRKLKNISHYRFTSESPVSHFDTFFDKYYGPDNKDFVAGYLIHLLSDMMWYHSVRIPFKESFLKAPAHNMSKNEAYYADAEQLEQLLFWEETAPRIIEAVSKGRAYTLEGLIESADVNSWKEKLIFEYNNRSTFLIHTTYISERQIRDYIADCAERSIEYLENLPYFQSLR